MTTTVIATDTLQERSHKMAEHFLNSKDYDIIETDWSCEQGGFDFIIDDNGALAFIKLLYRESDDGKLPEERPTKSKRTRYEVLAAQYLSKHNMPSGLVRFDIISMLLLGENQAFLRHHKDALSGIE